LVVSSKVSCAVERLARSKRCLFECRSRKRRLTRIEAPRSFEIHDRLDALVGPVADRAAVVGIAADG
jgi:hypothetical protein